jgi:hypothetical protein
MTNGEFQDAVLGVYENESQCEAAAVEQQVAGNCYPVKQIIRSDEVPADTTMHLRGVDDV